jgi:hypothetical protein
MRGLSSWLLSCAVVVGVLAAAPPMAASQVGNGKNCRMEQQCHWENFKKICVWVKVCR